MLLAKVSLPVQAARMRRVTRSWLEIAAFCKEEAERQSGVERWRAQREYSHQGGLADGIHSLHNQIGDVSPVLFLGLAEQCQGRATHFENVFLAIFADDSFNGADLQAAKHFRYVVDPSFHLLTHWHLFEQR